MRPGSLLQVLSIVLRIAQDYVLARGHRNLFIRMPPNLDSATRVEVADQEVRHDALEMHHLYNLARNASSWTAAQSGYLEHVKVSIIGKAYKYPRRLDAGDLSAPCAWDCYRRATMLEPIAARILDRGVEGDFCEAGVLYGGISIHMAAMLHARGELGSGKRLMWVADSFAGLPQEAYSASFEHGAGKGLGLKSTDLDAMLGKYRNAKLTGTKEVVQSNFHRHLFPFPFNSTSPVPFDGVRFVKGFFNESLPGPIAGEGRKIALLRIDSDIFSSIYETLERLYPLLSVGGYVVFDDWKIPQARAAAVAYRIRHGIRSKIFGSDVRHSPPFWTIDRMAFWQRRENETSPLQMDSFEMQAALWAAQRHHIRGGIQYLRAGVCFVRGTLSWASRMASKTAASATECYHRCESTSECVYFTFFTSSARIRCQLKTAVAMATREEGSSTQRCISGMPMRTSPGPSSS